MYPQEMVIMSEQISARCIFLANWKILTRAHAPGYNLFVNMALKRLPYAADIAVCLPRRSTFKLRGIVKNIHQLSAANSLSLVVSLDWCVNTLLCHTTTAEKVLCVLCRTSSSSQKGEGKLCIFFFSRHNCSLCIRLNVIAALLSRGAVPKRTNTKNL